MLNPLLRQQREAIDRATAKLHGFLKLNPEVSRQGRQQIRKIRTALGMSQAKLARQLKVTRQAVTDMEAREVDGAITLAQLTHAADLLHCDVVYMLAPRVPIDALTQQEAKDIAKRELAKVGRTMQLEAQGVTIGDREITDYIQEHITERDLWHG